MHGSCNDAILAHMNYIFTENCTSIDNSFRLKNNNMTHFQTLN